MRTLIVALVFTLISCGKASDTPTGSLGATDAAGAGGTIATDGLSPASPWAAFAGNWYNANPFGNGLPGTLAIDADGNVTHTYCSATWKLLELEPNNTPDAVRLEVLTTQGYRECPELGEQTCELKRIMIGTNSDIPAVRYSCPRHYNGSLEQAVGVFHE